MANEKFSDFTEGNPEVLVGIAPNVDPLVNYKLTLSAGALLQANGSGQLTIIPSLTTVQIAALTPFTLQRVFNTDDNDYEYYDGTRWVKEAHPKYKVYKVYISQTGTNAPTVFEVENNLGASLVWTRNSAGNYTGTLAGAFNGQVFPICQNIVSSSPLTYIQAYSAGGSDAIEILSLDASGAQADSILNSTPVEFQVYYP